MYVHDSLQHLLASGNLADLVHHSVVLAHQVLHARRVAHGVDEHLNGRGIVQSRLHLRILLEHVAETGIGLQHLDEQVRLILEGGYQAARSRQGGRYVTSLRRRAEGETAEGVGRRAGRGRDSTAGSTGHA